MDADWDVMIVGGGAAGLWAAGTAAARGRRTLVLEKNKKPGVKILMSGGTRCNLTHACTARGIVDAFGLQGSFLHSPLAVLGPADVVATIEEWGVPTKVEPSGKVFPRSDRALDVRNALVRRLQRAGAQLVTGEAVRDVTRAADGSFEVQCCDARFVGQSLIMATGGMSYPACGTTGDGYAWMRALQHSVNPPRPALTPLVSPESWVRELSGVTLEDIEIRVGTTAASRIARRDPRRTSRGGLLWTHFGLSGPAPMNISRDLSDTDNGLIPIVEIDLVPQISRGELLDTMLPARMGGATHVSSILRRFVPRRLAEQILARAEIPHERPLAELSGPSREAVARDLKSLRISISGTLGYAKAEVTAGGVSLKEVDSRTMRSRIVPGLFLIGEILDLDGPIGGYNFQAAFSTGHVAGLHA